MSNILILMARFDLGFSLCPRDGVASEVSLQQQLVSKPLAPCMGKFYFQWAIFIFNEQNLFKNLFVSNVQILFISNVQILISIGNIQYFQKFNFNGQDSI